MILRTYQKIIENDSLLQKIVENTKRNNDNNIIYKRA